MAGLIVDGAGLTASAASSAEIADRLAASAEGGPRLGGQPSHAGVSQFGAAVASVRIRQSARMSTHHTAMRTAAIRYTDADDEGAGSIARTV
ncbi:MULTISPECIES: hypothetical protein [unclassified Mycolicibacterium]|uniref:hypothetical protein n=1 Tax=unclassified Mycolicibacterium TaxID=2636767 RepID=UPI002ED99F2C